MRCGHEAAEAARAKGRGIDPSINPALIDTLARDAEDLTDCADGPHEPIPDETIHEVGQPRETTTGGYDRVRIDLIDPHLVLQKSEQRRLRVLERIRATGIAIHPNPKA